MSGFNEVYNRDKNPWGGQPEPLITTYLQDLKTGTVLDLGGGDGRNALYLAYHGFDVTSVDISDKAAELVTEKAKELKLENKITAVVADLNDYTIVESFDNIICNFTLHFLLPDAFGRLITEMQAKTTPGGLNIISDFTKTGPIYSPTFPARWLEDGELKILYNEWNSLYYQEKPMRTRQKDANSNNFMQNAAEIVARKPVN